MKKSVNDVIFVHGFFVLSKSDTESTVAGFRWCPKVVCKHQNSYYCGEKTNGIIPKTLLSTSVTSPFCQAKYI